MTNEQRQKSLEKKNGMIGGESYCSYCNYHSSGQNENNSADWGSRCCFMEYEDEVKDKTQCATAYNRMIRARSGKQATEKE